MNRDDIIRMAKEAGFTGVRHQPLFSEMLEEFAALVAAAEREECAKVCESLAGIQWVTREGSLECSDAIRARGQS